jgi:hypothetical protein
MASAFESIVLPLTSSVFTASEARSARAVEFELDEMSVMDTGMMMWEGGTPAWLDSELEETIEVEESIEVGGSLGGTGLGRGFIGRLQLHQLISRMNNKLIKTYKGFLIW